MPSDPTVNRILDDLQSARAAGAEVLTSHGFRVCTDALGGPGWDDDSDEVRELPAQTVAILSLVRVTRAQQRALDALCELLDSRLRVAASDTAHADEKPAP